MRITVTYTDDRVEAHFAECPVDIWGTYVGAREDVNAWLRRPRTDMEDRWAEVNGIDGVTRGHMPVPTGDEYGARELASQLETYRWLQEECPVVALATMCAEWGAPRTGGGVQPEPECPPHWHRGGAS